MIFKSILMTQAIACYLIKDGKVLLGLRKKVSNDLGLNIIGGIGGKIEDEETPKQATVREIKEEIEVDVLEEDLVEMGKVDFYFDNKPSWNQTVYIFTCEKWNNEPVETEPIKPEWFEINDLPFKRMWPDYKFWLPKVLNGEKVEGEFIYEDEKTIRVKKLS